MLGGKYFLQPFFKPTEVKSLILDDLNYCCHCLSVRGVNLWNNSSENVKTRSMWVRLKKLSENDLSMQHYGKFKLM